MRTTALLIPAACALALSACDNEQTAQAPATPEAPPAATAAAPSAPPASAAPPTATAAAPTNETTGAVAAAPAGQVPPAAGTQSAAATPPGIEPYRGRVYTAGPVSVRLNPDSTFEMNQTNGDQRVTGRYDFQNGIVRFAEPKGNVGTATFPMQCRFQPSGPEGFQLLENEGSCAQFKDLTFRAQAG